MYITHTVESLIYRIRLAMRAGLSRKQVAQAFSREYDQGTIFLAYHAAIMLEDDLQGSVRT